MIIKSVKDGGVLFQDDYKSYKKTIEHAVRLGVDLSYADLRKLDLRYANLDGGIFAHACLWGSDLSFCDMSESYCHHADFRLARLINVCAVQSILTHCDFRGVLIENMIWDEGAISNSQFSCPSVLGQNFSLLQSMQNVTYYHYGEVEITFTRSPIIISGLSKRIVIFDDCVMIGSEVKAFDDLDNELKGSLNSLCNHRDSSQCLKTA